MQNGKQSFLPKYFQIELGDEEEYYTCNFKVLRMSLTFDPNKTIVFLIGTSEYPSDGNFENIKPAESNIKTLKEIFLNKDIFGIPENKIFEFLNTQSHEILQDIEEKSSSSLIDTLIIHYTGHGVRESSKKLYLTASNTKKQLLKSTGIEYDRFSSIVESSKAQKKFIFLDCCYSGIAALSSDENPIPETELENIQGTYLVTSSPSNSVSFFDTDKKYTFFTQELINVLENGIENQTAFMEIGEIYNCVKEGLERNGYPSPKKKDKLNISGKVFFAKNCKYIEYQKVVTEADNLFREDKYDESIAIYRSILSSYSSYNTNEIENKIRAIEQIKLSKEAFFAKKFVSANQLLSNAFEILGDKAQISSLLKERMETYSTLTNIESNIRDEIIAKVTPKIEKETKEALLKNPDAYHSLLKQQLEQDYQTKLVNMEQELKEKIYQEFSNQNSTYLEKILILTSNPQNTSRIRTDAEIRDIHFALYYSKTYNLAISLATKASDLNKIILDTTPSFIHFTGHAHYKSSKGQQTVVLFFENEEGHAVEVNGSELAKLLNLFSIKFIFLNSCYTAKMAYELSQYVLFTIGVEGQIPDKESAYFSKNFYQALSSKKDIEFSYDFAKKAHSLIYENGSRFILFKRENFEIKPYFEIKPVALYHIDDLKTHNLYSVKG